MSRYCEVALTVPLRTTFTYSIPAEFQDIIAPGSRVAVPFRNRAMVGVVIALTDTPPDFSAKSANASVPKTKIKSVAHVLDAEPALTPKLIELGRWISSYYLAPPGDAFRAML